MLTPIIDLVMQVVAPLNRSYQYDITTTGENMLSMLMEDYLNVLQPILEWYL